MMDYKELFDKSFKLAAELREVKAENARLRAELDAAVKDLEHLMTESDISESCDLCANEHNEWETPITLGDHLDAAAAALKALQSQLSESQRREQAAVEDLKLALIDETLDPCHCCEYGRTNHCAHPDGPTCGETGGKNWEWRGSQEAGEGGPK